MKPNDNIYVIIHDIIQTLLNRNDFRLEPNFKSFSTDLNCWIRLSETGIKDSKTVHVRYISENRITEYQLEVMMVHIYPDVDIRNDHVPWEIFCTLRVYLDNNYFYNYYGIGAITCVGSIREQKRFFAMAHLLNYTNKLISHE